MRPESLPPEMKALLQAERLREGIPAEAQARLLRGLEASIMGAGAASATTGAAETLTAAAKGATLSASTLGALSLVFVAGGAIGVVLHDRIVPSTPAPLMIAAEPEPRAEVHAAANHAMRIVPALPPPVRPARAPVIAPRSPVPEPHALAQQNEPAPDLDLAEERALLAEAKASLREHRAERAMEILDRHARFPRARLAEEREALIIQALLQAGRRVDAVARAARFRDQFKGSMFWPVVDEALRSIP
jgi:hypothetical protein